MAKWDMSLAAAPVTDDQARQIALTYEATDRVYVLGGLASGLTVYKQQVRAHNLAFALSAILATESTEAVPPVEREIAVIGGGIAGLTLACALLSFPTSVRVTIFERRLDFCPLQQGSDTRWLHPRIYDWPALGSRAPSAGLPVMNWTEGRASDVASTILNRFADYCAWLENSTKKSLEHKLKVYLGLTHLTISAAKREIEWIGHLGRPIGGHFLAAEPGGDTKEFDAIILAAGFGLEANQSSAEASVNSYWRNDTLAQPALSGDRQVFVVSGFGDGGIVDLCRLTIERFRQDRILEELFGSSLDDAEALFRKELKGDVGGRVSVNVKDLIEDASDELRSILTMAQKNLLGRLRKDVRAVLQIGGSSVSSGSIDQIFGPSSSFLNRVLLYLLYKCGAFVVSFDSIETAAAEYGVRRGNIVVRHGTNALDNLARLFSDRATVAYALRQMKARDNQSPKRLWPLGVFPYVPQWRL